MIDRHKRILFTQIPKTATSSLFALLHTPEEMRQLLQSFADALNRHSSPTNEEIELAASERYLKPHPKLFFPAPDASRPLLAQSFAEQIRKDQSGRFLNLNGVGLSLYVRHMTCAQAETAISNTGDAIETYRRFSFVRNPWDWMLSQYYFRTEYLEKKTSLAHGCSFEEFLQEYAATLGHTGEAFCQLDYLSDSKGNLSVGFTGKFENLAADAPALCEYLGLPFRGLQHLRKTEKRKGLRYSDCYTGRARRMVAALCERDIDYFKYVF
jgi:hypothetical protein